MSERFINKIKGYAMFAITWTIFQLGRIIVGAILLFEGLKRQGRVAVAAYAYVGMIGMIHELGAGSKPYLRTV